MNPLLSILKTGSTSVFLMISRFFQAVESVLAMKEEFARAFSSGQGGDTRLFEKIHDLKFNNLLPTKGRVHMINNLLFIGKIFETSHSRKI